MLLLTAGNIAHTETVLPTRLQSNQRPFTRIGDGGHLTRVLKRCVLLQSRVQAHSTSSAQKKTFAGVTIAACAVFPLSYWVRSRLWVVRRAALSSQGPRRLQLAAQETACCVPYSVHSTDLTTNPNWPRKHQVMRHEGWHS